VECSLCGLIRPHTYLVTDEARRHRHPLLVRRDSDHSSAEHFRNRATSDSACRLMSMPDVPLAAGWDGLSSEPIPGDHGRAQGGSLTGWAATGRPGPSAIVADASGIRLSEGER